jgi:hypothetical protein
MEVSYDTHFMPKVLLAPTQVKPMSSRCEALDTKFCSKYWVPVDLFGFHVKNRMMERHLYLHL